MSQNQRTPNLAWNGFFLGLDSVTFSLGMCFIHQNTVLPSFVSRLTDSPVLIGLIPMLQSGGWLLPQVVAASYLHGKTRKQRYMLLPGAVGRPLYFALALAALALGADSSALLLALFFFVVGAFAVADALVSVPWYEILAKCIPYNARGRLMGIWQVVGGLAAIAGGWVVGLILGAPDLPFPQNYALLFFLSGLAFMVSLYALMRIREPEGVDEGEHRTIRAFFGQLLPALRNDHALRRVVLTRLAMGLGMMVYPFYIVYITKDLGVSRDHIGLFISAQVVGNMVLGPTMGVVADRFGTCAVLRMATGAAILVPVVALVAAQLSGVLGGNLVYFCTLIFVLIGATFAALNLGFMNHVLEIAPEASRTTYVALFNTATGVQVVFPLLAGAIVQVTSYSVVFVLAGLCALLSFGLSCRLTEPRRAVAGAAA